MDLDLIFNIITVVLFLVGIFYASKISKLAALLEAIGKALADGKITKDEFNEILKKLDELLKKIS